MNSHHRNDVSGFSFALVVERMPKTSTPRRYQRLVDAGAGSAKLLTVEGTTYAQCAPLATNPTRSLWSMVEALERAYPRGTVVGLGPELATVMSIALRGGLDFDTARAYAQRSSGPDGFPPPFGVPSGHREPVWLWAEVRDWLVRQGREMPRSLDPIPRDVAAQFVRDLADHNRARSWASDGVRPWFRLRRSASLLVAAPRPPTPTPSQADAERIPPVVEAADEHRQRPARRDVDPDRDRGIDLGR